MAEQAHAEPRLFIISGTQGAGKTTVAALLAGCFSRGVHVSADTLHNMIVSGRVWPDARYVTPSTPEVTGEAGRQLRLRLRLRLRLHNMCLLGRSFFEAGFSVVLDDIIGGERYAQLVDELGGTPFLFVMLTPDVEVVRRREEARGTRLFEEWEWLSEELQRTTPRTGLWLDTSEQLPEQTVAAILAHAKAERTSAAPRRGP